MNNDLKKVAEEAIERGALGASVKKGVFYVLAREGLVHELSSLIRDRLRGAKLVVCSIYDGGPKIIYVRRL
jgi:hypothetical protein